MFLHIKEAKYLSNYKIWVRFNDGAIGEIDLESDLWGEMIEPLKNKNKFKKFKLDPDLETIVWENGFDLAPEYIYQNMKVIG